MPKNPIVSNEAEELSRLIDEINCRQPHQSDTQEINELLEAANFLKSTIPAKPPQHIVDQTVDKIIAESVQRRTKRRSNWLYSGALSTAAAVLLVIGLNSSTLWPQKEQPAVVPSTIPIIQEAAPQKAAEENLHKPDTSASLSASQRETAPQTQINNAPIPSIPPAALAKPAPSNTEQPSVTVRQAPSIAKRVIKEEKPQLTEKLQKSAAVSPKDPTPLTVLSLPDKKPDAVITDKETGTIQQIYAKGTPQELIITQQALPASGEGTAGKIAATTSPDLTSGIKPTGPLHRISIQIHGQQVTVEGTQSEDELLKIAKTLVPQE